MKIRAGLVLLAVATLAGCSGPSGPSRLAGPARAASGARVQDTPDELPAAAALPELLRYAEDGNPGLMSARARWRAAEARISRERSLQDPQLMYEFESVGGTRQDMLTLGQAVPWPGKLLLAGSVAAREAEAARRRYEGARLALHYRVRLAWWEYWYFGRAAEAAGDGVALARAAEEVARARHKAAAAGLAEVLKAQMELARAEDMLREYLAMLPAAAARLNAELGRPAGAWLPRPEAGPSGGSLVASDAQVLTWAGASSPELGAMEAEVDAARDALALARRGPIPDLMVQAGVASMKESGMDRETGAKLGVGITLPLWFGRYRAEREEADARLVAAQAARRESGNRLSADVSMVLFALRDAERKLSLYREAILPRAEQAQETLLAAYRVGKAGFADLLEAQRSLLQFRLELARAGANREQRLAELEMLSGRELPREPGPDASTLPASAPVRLREPVGKEGQP
ncbi:MAG TPA: TolC family protein [Planctomycetota bacterium]|nr:TolC family protein [Planctomycetota bacterium]